MKHIRIVKEMTFFYIIQAFSTFSYATLYSSLSLFLLKQLNLPPLKTANLVALFIAFNHLLHLFGGLIGARFMSNRLLFLITSVLQLLGSACLLWKADSGLYYGLTLFLLGCGIGSTSYKSILNYYFRHNEHKREQAYFLSYSAMNLGFFLGFIVSGFYDGLNNYTQMFYICTLTTILSLYLLKKNWRYMQDDSATNRNTALLLGLFILFLLGLFVFYSLHSANFSNRIISFIAIIMVCILLAIARKQASRYDRHKIYAYLLLALSSVLFWAIYFTGPIGVTLFVKTHVDRRFLSYEVPTQWLLNINPLVIILAAPLVARLIRWLQNKGFNFNTPQQFASGFVFLSLAFFVLALGIRCTQGYGYTHSIWIVLHGTAKAIAELLIGPVGYAMVSRIAPNKLFGVLMGTWMMVSGIAAALSHYISNSLAQYTIINIHESNQLYQQTFFNLGLCAILAALFLLLISNKIQDLMDGRRALPELAATASEC